MKQLILLLLVVILLPLLFSCTSKRMYQTYVVTNISPFHATKVGTPYEVKFNIGDTLKFLTK